MKSLVFLAIAVLAALPASADPLVGSGPPRFVVLPFRTIGVSDTTAAAFRELVAGGLETRGGTLVAPPEAPSGVISSANACDDTGCAEAAAARYDAAAVYGSMSRLGDKIVVRLRAMRGGEDGPYYTDQIAAVTEEDLDAVARRFADGIASGRSSSDRATVDTIVKEETLAPGRRAARSGAGVRAGFLWPAGTSYAGADRMTSFRFVYKYETRNFAIETTPILGIAWGDGNAEWTLLDISASRILGVGDTAGYLLGGFGVHSVHVERDEVTASDNATTLTADLGIGLLAMRTYGMEIVVEARFHHVFDNFDKAGGGGADGLLVTFGTSR